MNTKLLLRIKKAILAEPKRFGMDYWINTQDTVAPCGTAACIGGFAMMLTTGIKTLHPKAEVWKAKGAELDKQINSQDYDECLNVGREAEKALDLSYEEGRRLFHINRWPHPFYGDYDNATTKEKMAKVAAARIDFFIQTNGTDKL